MQSQEKNESGWMESEKPRKNGNGLTLDKLLARGGGGVALAIMIWMNSNLSSVRSEISGLRESLVKVTTELELVAPKEVQASVIKVEREMLRKSDVEQIVAEKTPWRTDRPIIEQRLREIERQLNELRSKQ